MSEKSNGTNLAKAFSDIDQLMSRAAMNARQATDPGTALAWLEVFEKAWNSLPVGGLKDSDG